MTNDATPLRDMIAQISEERLKEAFRLARGSITVTAEILGVSRPTVYAMLRRYNIERTMGK